MRISYGLFHKEPYEFSAYLETTLLIMGKKKNKKKYMLKEQLGVL